MWIWLVLVAGLICLLISVAPRNPKFKDLANRRGELNICKCEKPVWYNYYIETCKTCGGLIEKKKAEKKEITKTDTQGQTMDSLQENSKGER